MKMCCRLVAASSSSVILLWILLSQGNDVQATARPLTDPKRLEQSAAEYITVTGCNNDCDIACCYCDIRKRPPLCVQCCKEWH
ncbi:unnamed protein product [Cuscuta campestris]|uniref:Embryo surrounding factor 1 brassicaceae domain-containing protein n=2 Tax=Cuscuta sect. Cleistogrammica TaxID=1824901 RepID=A0A484N6X1_9ASTE|nr:hypothetical protein DM860_005187 [Cuscuta australis]VFQ96852.1 unnamed protein product [Cuscuta campestris]